MSACIDTSVGIQWLAHPARYFSHAHRYFIGSSWLTSARALIIALSSTLTRGAPRWISPRPVASAMAVLLVMSLVMRVRAPLLAGFAVGVVDGAGGRLRIGTDGGRDGCHGNRVELAVGAAQRALLHAGGRPGPQVVRGLQAAAPREPVQLVELSPAGLVDVEVERLGLVDPLLPARGGPHQPLRVDLERGGVPALEVAGHPVDVLDAAVEVLQVGDHDLVPQPEFLQLAHQ